MTKIFKMLKKPKIVLIGAGNIGGTLAHLIGLKQLGDVILLDIQHKQAQGKALDLSQALAITAQDAIIQATDDYKDLEGADAVIVTAGVPRKSHESREDMAFINAEIIKPIAKKIKTYASNAFVIVLTNPLDIMTYIMLKESGLNDNMVVGMAGVLDSARFQCFLAKEFNVSTKSVTASVIGAHNDSMLPLARYSTVNGVPVPDLIKMGFSTEERIEAITNRTKKGGAEIVSLFNGNSSAYYAPATAAIEILESYLKNQRKVLPCSVYVNGEYGIYDLCMGIPVIVGSDGIEKFEIPLNSNEKSILEESSRALRHLLQSIINA